MYFKMAINLNWFVRMSAEFETNVTSAERIEEYCNTPHEVFSFLFYLDKEFFFFLCL